MIKKASGWMKDMLHLFYPQICAACGTDILSEQQFICIKCHLALPRTGFAYLPNNPIEKIFWGRLRTVAAHSEFYFSKEALVQRLIHQLKYNQMPEAGFYLGELTGKSMLQSGRFSNIDYVVPLPLFPDKEKKRGYNQAAAIGEGISKEMNIPLLNGIVNRNRHTETQTKKHRTERWKNVFEGFVIKNPSTLHHKHVLLVDDVVTTGATLEACGHAIMQLPGTQLSIATITFASK
jgi:ComF family protein